MMTKSEAERFIELHLQPAVNPTLTDDELDQLVAMAQVVDDDGLAPDDADWTPSYGVAGCHYAIAEGYQVKYAKAVGRFSFTTDGQTFTRNQTLDHLEHQRSHHLAKVQTTVGTGFEVLTNGEVDAMRATSASALPDVCEIDRAPADEVPTFDENTGDLVPAAVTVVYQGACRVRPRGSQELDTQVGDLMATLGPYVGTLPHDVDVQVDDFLTLTESSDAAMVGRAFRVVHLGWSSWQIDRRVGLEDRERPDGNEAGS